VRNFPTFADLTRTSAILHVKVPLPHSSVECDGNKMRILAPFGRRAEVRLNSAANRDPVALILLAAGTKQREIANVGRVGADSASRRYGLLANAGCPPVSPRGAAAEIECAVSIRRCCRRGHVNRNAVQGAAREQVPFIGEARRHVPSRRRPETIWREKETRAYAGR
jgi:hypothetical protein